MDMVFGCGSANGQGSTTRNHTGIAKSAVKSSAALTSYVFELWKEWKRDRPGTINDGFGFWINGEIALLMDIPNTKATREYHNRDRA